MTSTGPRRGSDQLDSELDEDGRAEVLTQLARVEGLRDEFAAAERLLVEAEELASSDVARARIDLERGRVLRSGGNPHAAFPLFVAAYNRATGRTRRAPRDLPDLRGPDLKRRRAEQTVGMLTLFGAAAVTFMMLM